MTKVKICGITNYEDAMAACEAGADALGFNFAEEARRRSRYIDPDDAQKIVERLPPFVTSVVVCVNQTERAAEFLEFVDMVQFHGEETPDECQAVSTKVIKAFRSGPDFAVDSMEAWPAAAYLLDAFVAGERGGTGVVSNWTVARKAAEGNTPLMLAGGLTPENVVEAIRLIRPYGVDTAGGVESEPGKKDHERIRRFIQNAKSPLS